MGILANLKMIETGAPAAAVPGDDLGAVITAAAGAVHAALGGGLDADIYRACFAAEMTHRGVRFARDVAIDANYRGEVTQAALRADFMIENSVPVFIVAAQKDELHNLLLRSCLKISGGCLAYLLNFRTDDMRRGIMRAYVQTGNVMDRRPETLRKNGAARA